MLPRLRFITYKVREKKKKFQGYFIYVFKKRYPENEHDNNSKELSNIQDNLNCIQP